MKITAPTLLWGLTVAFPTLAHAEVKPNSLFTDSAVLQRDVAVPVFGTAKNGEKVTVEFAGQKVSTIAKDGQWMVKLAPLTMNVIGAKMTIAGENTVVLNDVLVGEVWICSGQSNMERQLGPRPPQKEIEGWREAAASADLPLIRQFKVPNRTASAPISDAGGSWVVCTPKSAPDFSAVGFFFARDLQKALNVPVGMIFSSWGGTIAEAWTSGPALKTLPDFADAVKKIEGESKAEEFGYDAALARFYEKNDPGSAPGKTWAAPDLKTENWKSLQAEELFKDPAVMAFDGISWVRKEIEIPADYAGKAAILHLGKVDDDDTTWINGVLVGATEGFQWERNYKIPENVLKPGRNVLAIRIYDTGGPGGVGGDTDALKLELPGQTALPPLPLTSPWKLQLSTPMADLPGPPRRSIAGNPNVPTVLYNAMIAPLIPYALKGVIWYQGESNQDRAAQYQTLFPLLIADWRKNFAQGDFPFLFVQIAPFGGMRPEIREAQFLTLQKSPNTAMAVTTDVGDANDIHPARKAPVGARLALAARVLAYGEKIEYSGPLYENLKIEDNRAIVAFSHVGGGLVAKDGPLRGFQIAGADGKWVDGIAEIAGQTVVVTSTAVPNPTNVRYGWANVPDVNLFNAEGLPASPFRTNP